MMLSRGAKSRKHQPVCKATYGCRRDAGWWAPCPQCHPLGSGRSPACTHPAGLLSAAARSAEAPATSCGTRPAPRSAGERGHRVRAVPPVQRGRARGSRSAGPRGAAGSQRLPSGSSLHSRFLWPRSCTCQPRAGPVGSTELGARPVPWPPRWITLPASLPPCLSLSAEPSTARCSACSRCAQDPRRPAARRGFAFCGITNFSTLPQPCKNPSLPFRASQNDLHGNLPG